MTGALAWLNDLMVWLGRWVPRLLLIQPTHRGVRFGPRGGAKQVGPGLVIYWPITHTILQVPITTQSLELSGQVLPESRLGSLPQDEHRVIPHVALFSAAIQFSVSDAVKATTAVLHLHALIDNRAKAAIARHFDSAHNPNEWLKKAEAALASDVKPFGVKLERLDFTQAGVGLAVKNISDWSYSDSTNGTHSLDKQRG